MKFGSMHSSKYRPQLLTVDGEPLELLSRQWPQLVGTRVPRWCSVDLRDGNQALVTPMSPAAKLELFAELRRLGVDEIEVGFPAASTPDFEFCRKLVDEGRLDDEVTISVLTQCREEQLKRTFEAVAGAPRAVVHFYNSTSELQRRVTFGASKSEIVALAVDAAKMCVELEHLAAGTPVSYEYSPESFTGTELDFAVEICSAVLDVLDPTSRDVIVNLPATVEHQPPSMYADAIEWFCDHLPNRDEVTVSVHPHNDRGCAVAAAEAAVAAGADRVEGTLFGNGERTGNVDLVTLAGNLHAWGIDPGLDLSDVLRTRRVAERVTGIEVHPRHPYAGDLAWVAFSGSHQDAIDKGLRALSSDEVWAVPYLPVDPADFGRGYEPVIRVNSQSGRGGVRHLVADHTGHLLPTPLSAVLATHVQRLAEDQGGEVSATDIVELFTSRFATPVSLVVRSFEVADAPDEVSLTAQVLFDGEPVTLHGVGNGPVSAFCAALSKQLGVEVSVEHYFEAALEGGAEARAGAYVEVSADGRREWGVGEATSTTRAALEAIAVAVSQLRS